MDGRELLATGEFGFDPEAVAIDDAEAFDLLEPAVREWWVDEFGEYVPDNGGFFTPPQKEAVPLIHAGENALVASPTGSGKCLRPDTPLLVREDGNAEVVRAAELRDRRGDRLADVDGSGRLYDSDLASYSLDTQEWTVDGREALVYEEPYDGELHRIRTRYGREVEVTPEHPLLVETGHGHEWRRAAAVEEGDRVGVPRRLDLPERRIELDVGAAVEALRERFRLVLTPADSAAVERAVEAADTLDDLDGRTVRSALGLAGLPQSTPDDPPDRDSSTVPPRASDRGGGRTLDAVAEALDPLDDDELLVVTDGGRRSRFRAPADPELDPELARLCAFVIAEGVAGLRGDDGTASHGPERGRPLEAALRTVRQRFDVVPRENGGNGSGDHATPGDCTVAPPLAYFLSELLGTGAGRDRAARLPGWVLNATADAKRAFVSTFLSLDATAESGRLAVTRAEETSVEQLSYLLLSFGVFPARETADRPAPDADALDPSDRRRHTLAIRGAANLERACAAFDLDHPDVDAAGRSPEAGPAETAVDRYRFDAAGIGALSRFYGDEAAFEAELGDVHATVRRSGFITRRGLETLRESLESLPDAGIVVELAARVEGLLSRNVTWLEVTGRETVDYEGPIVDLSVPDTHNFIGGRGGLYLHNTLASFTSVIDELYRTDREDGLENSVYCLYVSPLKSLANDIHRNLAVPLEGIAERAAERGHEIEIRHAIRHGDTPDAERQRMLDETPHILNTTPETLAILLNSPKFKEKLRTVQYVVVDEIHSLAGNKRGTHLSVSLERLEALCEGSPTRIGCSATVEPLETMARFLVGCEEPPAPDAGPDAEPVYRDCGIVDARFVREFDIELVCPTDDLINTPPGVVNDRFYDRLHRLIDEHTNTLVFTNTRSGAERVLHDLRERYDGYDEGNSGCHHGSLSKDERGRVESGLKEGRLDVVTTSTSLELGIDMPHIDLVVQVGSPKSVAALLQRVGRAGHQLGETVAGRVFALDRDELIECAVMLRKAAQGFVDRVFVPERAHDVAAQHVYGMAINAVRTEREVKAILRRAYPYRTYDGDDWASLVRYLTADYQGMEDRDVYAKVWRDANDPPDGDHHYSDYPVGETLIGRRGRMARVIYMTNLGTIPDSFDVDVFIRSDDEWVGQLDEEYLDTLEKGDVFVLGGSRYEFRYRRGTKAYVDPTNARPTVPSWFSERLPLSYDLGREILRFQGELLDRLAEGPAAARAWLRDFPIDDDSVRALVRMFDAQLRYAGPESVSTGVRLAIEPERDYDEYRRRYYVHSNYGRRFNDGFSRLLAYHLARETGANVEVAVADHGFSLSVPLNRKVDLAGLIADLSPEAVRPDLRASLQGTDLLKRYFRINATRSLMILKRYKGYEKSAAEQQVSSEMLLSFAEELEGFAVVEETYREILEDKLNVGAIETVVDAIGAGKIDVATHRVESPTPRAFGLATLMASDVVLAEEESEVLRRFHRRVMEAIDGDGEGDGARSEAEN